MLRALPVACVVLVVISSNVSAGYLFGEFLRDGTTIYIDAKTVQMRSPATFRPPIGNSTTSSECENELQRGRIFISTGATSGRQIFVCEGTGGWVLQGDGGAGGGETNTVSNQGAWGLGLFKQKTGADFEFLNLSTGSIRVSISSDATNDLLLYDVNESSLTLNNMAGAVSDAQIQTDFIAETELDTEAKLETQITDMANIIQEAEIDTKSELQIIVTDVEGFSILEDTETHTGQKTFEALVTISTSLHVTTLDCTGNSNGGALTADADGVISCSDDDSGGVGGSTWTAHLSSIQYTNLTNTANLGVVTIENTSVSARAANLRLVAGQQPGITFLASTVLRAEVYTDGSGKFRIKAHVCGSQGNILIDSTGDINFRNCGTGGTIIEVEEGQGLIVYNAIDSPASATNGVLLYSTDVASSAELFGKDEAGNSSQLTAHAFTRYDPSPDEPMPVQKAYCNDFTGECIEIDLIKLALIVQNSTTTKIIHEFSKPPEVWDNVEEEKRVIRVEEQSVWDDAIPDDREPRRPPDYIKLAPPKWLQQRLVKQGRGSSLPPRPGSRP